MGGNFSSVDLEMGVRVRLQEVSDYGRLRMWSFSREIAGTAVWCPLMRGVRSREMSVKADLHSTILAYDCRMRFL